ncbi:manganese efflux pump MntP [[Clostridium] polysaccharolyticum]|uniref:Putative manganese efflux pump MntP n=1 Tax=[Clostridium] polysaccharolyticum TaxID=29364 RepID=A0A1H9YRA3_9FIRM|nr:manganese efflux pump MntP family protein [[Clostridium] polysaccharolyticum]SES71658.1 Putative Mn2+ efflux pump MntP [[Clostridium] polysaccharolyticum]
MSYQEIFLIGVGLSMDAFAVALCKGLNMKKVNYVHTIIIALFFGGFQAFMPLIGWFLGKSFESCIKSVDHWIAFALLAYIGGKMVYEAIKGEEEKEETAGDKLDLKELTIMAVATSIDALAVGITLAFLKVSIASSITIIGITTFVLSFGGVMIGNRFGMKFKSKAEIAGGVILILIGLKILLEHLGVIFFNFLS